MRVVLLLVLLGHAVGMDKPDWEELVSAEMEEAAEAAGEDYSYLTEDEEWAELDELLLTGSELEGVGDNVELKPLECYVVNEGRSYPAFTTAAIPTGYTMHQEGLTADCLSCTLFFHMGAAYFGCWHMDCKRTKVMLMGALLEKQEATRGADALVTMTQVHCCNSPKCNPPPLLNFRPMHCYHGNAEDGYFADDFGADEPCTVCISFEDERRSCAYGSLDYVKAAMKNEFVKEEGGFCTANFCNKPPSDLSDASDSGRLVLFQAAAAQAPSALLLLFLLAFV